MGATAPPIAKAQPQAVALFVSDLHLQQSMPRTTQAFFDFLQGPARSVQQLYLLGDIFEYWAGDDDLAGFNGQVAQAIRAVSDGGVAVFWIAGNRDFLAGADFANACGLTILPDPFVADIAGNKLVLTHGDMLCTDDAAYLAFRAQVRTPEWQRDFLAKPLPERKAIIAGLRQGSRDAQRNKAAYIMDVNAEAVAALFDLSASGTMVHGHTHRPARHVSSIAGKECVRHVLPDWDCEAEPARGGWLALAADGRITRFEANGQVAP